MVTPESSIHLGNMVISRQTVCRSTSGMPPTKAAMRSAQEGEKPEAVEHKNNRLLCLPVVILQGVFGMLVAYNLGKTLKNDATRSAATGSLEYLDGLELVCKSLKHLSYDWRKTKFGIECIVDDAKRVFYRKRTTFFKLSSRKNTKRLAHVKFAKYIELLCNDLSHVNKRIVMALSEGCWFCYDGPPSVPSTKYRHPKCAKCRKEKQLKIRPPYEWLMERCSKVCFPSSK